METQKAHTLSPLPNNPNNRSINENASPFSPHPLHQHTNSQRHRVIRPPITISSSRAGYPPTVTSKIYQRDLYKSRRLPRVRRPISILAYTPMYTRRHHVAHSSGGGTAVACATLISIRESVVPVPRPASRSPPPPTTPGRVRGCDGVKFIPPADSRPQTSRGTHAAVTYNNHGGTRRPSVTAGGRKLRRIRILGTIAALDRSRPG